MSYSSYLRYHGKSRGHNYHYSEDEIDRWYKRLKELKGIDRLYIYFNNDHSACAVENARMLQKLFI